MVLELQTWRHPFLQVVEGIDGNVMISVRKNRNSTLTGQQSLNLREITMPCPDVLTNRGLGRKNSRGKTTDGPGEKTLEGS